MKTWIASIFVLVTLAGCKVDPPIPAAPENADYIPPDAPAQVYNFNNNPWSEAGFELGRALFYDTQLSADNTISCGSCHQQFTAFANADHALSHGINGLFGKRNAPALFNIAWHPYFMHDGGINNIEVQPLGPMMNPVEMGEKLDNVIAKLNASDKYRHMFRDAFGSDGIDSQQMLKAMAQFMGKMNSFNSKYDKVRRREKGVEFSEAEGRGYALFQSKCSKCHNEPLFTDFVIRSNGIPVSQTLQDSGRARITGLAQDLYKFKTPSLRNITMTWPYMHDGRFTTLDQCLDHYSDNSYNPVNLDPLLKAGISITAAEKADIISFLQTLTDQAFLKDPRFADPNYR